MKKPDLKLLSGRRPGPHAWFLDKDGNPQTGTLPEAAHSVSFEDVMPVRSGRVLKNHRKKSWYSGFYWSATNGRHVVYESWLEKRRLTLLDFDIDTVGISGQPMWLFGRDGREHWEHCPDFFVRHADQSATVYEVKGDHIYNDFIASSKYRAVLDACAEVGWGYEVLREPDRQQWMNVEWLAGYRQPFADPTGIQQQLLEACSEPTPFIPLAESVGPTVITLPHLWRLIWQQRLEIDLYQPVRSTTPVRPALERRNKWLTSNS